ncbi:hypothetical protein SDC9_73900 [bioreactor metagenome]|uniref:Uncharacterized protein n=1 Tax=bioreactor metagenome TaxID=1076179 RepID=A0A644YGC8_9ZZZZ
MDLKRSVLPHRSGPQSDRADGIDLGNSLPRRRAEIPADVQPALVIKQNAAQKLCKALCARLVHMLRVFIAAVVAGQIGGVRKVEIPIGNVVVRGDSRNVVMRGIVRVPLCEQPLFAVRHGNQDNADPLLLAKFNELSGVCLRPAARNDPDWQIGDFHRALLNCVRACHIPFTRVAFVRRFRIGSVVVPVKGVGELQAEVL